MLFSAKSVSGVGAFGPGFIPGKVKSARDAAARALGMRWSGLPADDTSAVSGRPPSYVHRKVKGSSA